MSSKTRAEEDKMKISKSKLRQIIKEELYRDRDAMRGAERPGAGIEDIPQPEVEDDFSHVAELLGTPEGTLMAKMMAREILDQFASFPELADAIPAIDRDEMTARVVAAMRDNRMYDPVGLEEAAPWDKEALKGRYPKDYKKHAIIDQEHAYGTGIADVMKKLKRRPGASTRPNQGRWTY